MMLCSFVIALRVGIEYYKHDDSLLKFIMIGRQERKSHPHVMGDYTSEESEMIKQSIRRDFGCLQKNPIMLGFCFLNGAVY